MSIRLVAVCASILFPISLSAGEIPAGWKIVKSPNAEGSACQVALPRDWTPEPEHPGVMQGMTLADHTVSILLTELPMQTFTSAKEEQLREYNVVISRQRTARIIENSDRLFGCAEDRQFINFQLYKVVIPAVASATSLLQIVTKKSGSEEVANIIASLAALE